MAAIVSLSLPRQTAIGHERSYEPPAENCRRWDN
jgi:hypothetical protein